jgi:hypothetical protein
MNKHAVTPQMDVPGWDPKFPFDLVVAYEDSDTRNRALHLYDYLAQQLLNDTDFQCSWWKFDHLANDILRGQASAAASEANMVILSLHARQDLSPAQRSWIESWITRRSDRQAALVTLIGGAARPEVEAPSMLNYLQGAARRAGMDFFMHAFDLPGPAFKLSVTPPVARAPLTNVILQDTLQENVPVSRWGINE